MDKATYIKEFHNWMNSLTKGSKGGCRLCLNEFEGGYCEVDLYHYNGEIAIFWFKGGASIEYSIFEGKFGKLLYGKADPHELLRNVCDLMGLLGETRNGIILGLV